MSVQTPPATVERPAHSGARVRSSWRIPPNLFGIPFGVTGLAAAWRAAAGLPGFPLAVSNGLYVAGALLWCLAVGAYLAQGWRQVRADLTDPVLGPFVSIAPICAMLLGVALAAQSTLAGQIVIVVFLIVTITLGGWLTARWITAELDEMRVHPGYFLPTVAGGLVGAYAAAEAQLPAVGWASFGIGMVCWVLLGSIVLNRLFLRARLAGPLTPTLAIEVAPPVIGGIACFALTGDRVTVLSEALGGYAVLMLLVQLALIPLYRKLSFSPAFWAFTFPFAATATDALLWVKVGHPPGATALAIVILAIISGLIAAIFVRSAIAIRRGEFFARAHRD
jgi:tellurite resistance protein